MRKKLLHLWFSDTGHPYTLKRHIPVVNSRLLSIKPPNIITRTPREVYHAGKWKGYFIITCTCIWTFHNVSMHCFLASEHHACHTTPEHHAWLLYYSIPVLSGLLPQRYLEHHELLVCSLHILLGDTITTTDLSLTQETLEVYCRNFETLYGNY